MLNTKSLTKLTGALYKVSDQLYMPSVIQYKVADELISTLDQKFANETIL